MKKFLFLSAFALICSGPSYSADLDNSAPNSDPSASYSSSFIDELRLGSFLHAPASPEAGSGYDLNAEVLFAKPWGTDDQWWMPRPHIGTTINFEGKTSTAYAGVTWQYHVTNWAFVEGSFGGSLNNGETQDLHDDHNPLGCHALFRESASLGFDLSRNWRIMATAEHSSNANLCEENRGLTNYGVRVGYHF